jgi:hypothetical protein
MQRSGAVTAALGQQCAGDGELQPFVRQPGAGGLQRQLHQALAQGQVARGQRGDGQGLEMLGIGAAAARVRRQGQHLVDVGQRIGGAAHLGQADDAIDPQHAAQEGVAHVRRAGEALVDVAQRFLEIAQLQQFV